MIIRNEPNKTNTVDIPFEMVRFLSYLIFPKCTYSFFLPWKRKNMSYFCYFTLIIIIFHSFECFFYLFNLFLLLVCLYMYNICFLTFIFNFFLFLRPIHHLNLQTNQSLSSLYNNLGPCHFDNRIQRP